MEKIKPGLAKASPASPGTVISCSASESSMKRRPPVRERSTTGGKPTVADKTRRHDRVRPVLPREPEDVHHSSDENWARIGPVRCQRAEPEVAQGMPPVTTGGRVSFWTAILPEPSSGLRSSPPGALTAG